MDNRRFDSLTRALASGQSRRQILKSLIGLGGVAVVTTQTSLPVEARRSSRKKPEGPTTTPAPTATMPPCTGVPCGYDCCDYEAQCCDSECCAEGFECLTYYFPDGPYVAEEVCCRADLICDTETTKCCAGDERCCATDGVSFCIPAYGCCDVSECPLAPDSCSEPICPVGEWTCQTSRMPDGTSCDSGNLCTKNDTCQSGTCTPGEPTDCEQYGECYVESVCDPNSGCPETVPQQSGFPCGSPASCDNDVAHAADTCDGNGNCIPGEDTPCGSTGTCVGDVCQGSCLELQQVCDPTDNRCCNARCEDVRTCGAENQPQCCVGASDRCDVSCDCCDPYECVDGVCCGNLQGTACDEQRICCTGYQCLGGTCQPETCLAINEVCTADNNACCQDEETDCQFLLCPEDDFGLPRCCHVEDGTCSRECDCCPGFACESGKCIAECRTDGESCSDGGVCCDGLTCESGHCRAACGFIGENCFAGGVCCSDDLECIGIEPLWFCCGSEGTQCHSVGQFQTTDGGGTTNECCPFALVCGANLECEACGTEGDSCALGPAGSFDDTCCHYLGLNCFDGVCASPGNGGSCNINSDCGRYQHCVNGDCEYICGELFDPCVPPDPNIPQSSDPCCDGLICGGEWPNWNCRPGGPLSG